MSGSVRWQGLGEEVKAPAEAEAGLAKRTRFLNVVQWEHVHGASYKNGEGVSLSHIALKTLLHNEDRPQAAAARYHRRAAAMQCPAHCSG